MKGVAFHPKVTIGIERQAGVFRHQLINVVAGVDGLAQWRAADGGAVHGKMHPRLFPAFFLKRRTQEDLFFDPTQAVIIPADLEHFTFEDRVRKGIIPPP